MEYLQVSTYMSIAGSTNSFSSQNSHEKVTSGLAEPAIKLLENAVHLLVVLVDCWEEYTISYQKRF
jgi:hypothetical protein